MKSLVSRVELTLQKYKMLNPGERVWVACSGGPDSVALFHLLREIAPHLGIRLGLLHFDHALRKESRRDFQFVKALARRLHLPFFGARAEAKAARKGLSPEENARALRYDFFEKAAKKSGVRKIALAHHRDDQAETILMRLIQGTGLRGLRGIRPVLQRKGTTFIRPLIQVSRSEIRRFLKKNSFTFREDSTNRSRRFLRNRIRWRLLPVLEREFNPRIREALCRLAETACAESKGLDDWIRQNWKKYLASRRNGTLQLERDRFLSLPPFLQFRLLDQILRQADPQSGLDFESWERIEKELTKGRVRMTLPRNLDLNLTGKKLFIRKNDTINNEVRKKRA